MDGLRGVCIMTTPQYNRQAQAWDNRTPESSTLSEDGLPPMGMCPFCGDKLWYSETVFLLGHHSYESSCLSCNDYDSTISEEKNREEWLSMEADRMRGEECENEADRRSERGGW
jgi:hypothetical protein